MAFDIAIQHWHSTLAFNVGLQRVHLTLAFNIGIQRWHSTLAFDIGMPSAAEAGVCLSPVGYIASLCFLKITYRVGRRVDLAYLTRVVELLVWMLDRGLA